MQEEADAEAAVRAEAVAEGALVLDARGIGLAPDALLEAVPLEQDPLEGDHQEAVPLEQDHQDIGLAAVP